jgi:hypothetical protein
MVSPLMSRYGEAYERLLDRHRDHVFIAATRMPAEGELFSRDSPTFTIRLDYMHKRVDAYLENFRRSPLYCIGDPDADADGEATALDDAITLYAMGGTDVTGVQACAKAYVKACKRPEPPPSPERRYGNEEPPSYRDQKKNTYHWTQYRPTYQDKAMQKRMADREKAQRDEAEALYQSSAEAHRDAYPKCINRYCPFCRIDSDDLQL